MVNQLELYRQKVVKFCRQSESDYLRIVVFWGIHITQIKTRQLLPTAPLKTMFYLLFILFRTLDILTTSIGIARGSYEANPIYAFVIGKWGIEGFILVNGLLSLLVLLAFYLTRKKNISQYTLSGFLIMNAIIILINLFTLANNE